MIKKIISHLLCITIISGSLNAYATEEEPSIVLNNSTISDVFNNIQLSDEEIPHISNITSIPLNNTISLFNNVQLEEYEQINGNPKIEITDIDSVDLINEDLIPAVGSYVSQNEQNEIDEEDEIQIDDDVADGEIAIVQTENNQNARTVTTSFDTSYRIGNINAKDSFALQNQIGKTHFIGDNIGEEYVDPMTGNLIVTETDLILPGIDGLDLKLQRYYSLAQAELLTKSTGIVTDSVTFEMPEGSYVVTETVTNTETNDVSTYKYPYTSSSEANLRIEEIESRDTCDGLYRYDATKEACEEGDLVTVDYYYTSDLTSSSYQRTRNDLGAGWSWSFPSLQILKNNYEDINEKPKSIYYHDGKGNVMEIDDEGYGNYSFKNYVGKDITFEDYFDYDNDISSNGRIDYIVNDANGTNYYFGKYGELYTIMDRYGNKITFNYQYKSFYGVNNCPIISKITDTVGRTVNFSYRSSGNFEYINITVTSSLEPDENLTLEYKKKLIEITKNNALLTSEPVLESVTNTIGEITEYYPAPIKGNRDYVQPILFTFADKQFDSSFVYNTSGCSTNYIYLLGNIVRPSSNTYYDYDPCDRNLGHSGITQAYRIEERGDNMLVIYSDNVIIDGYSNNVIRYNYSRDYTAYPIYCSIESVPDGKYVATMHEYKGDNVHTSIDYYKIDDAILKKYKGETYTNPVGNDLSIKYTYLSFLQKQPQRVELLYSNGDEYSYNSYMLNLFIASQNKSYGKPSLSTFEIDYDTSHSSNRDMYAYSYEYDDNTGFMLNKSWYQSANKKCTEYYTYNNQQRLSNVCLADGTSESYTYTYNSYGKVTKKTTTSSNDSGTTVIEENYTSQTGYAFPSTVVKTVTANDVTSTQTTAYTYNMLLGVVESETDNAGNVTYYEYDKLGRATKVIYPQYTTYTDYNTKGLCILPVEEITYETYSMNYDEVIVSDEVLIVQGITNQLGYYDVTNTNVTNPTNINLSNLNTTYLGAEINYYLGTGEIIQSNVLDTVNDSPDLIQTNYYYDTDSNTITVVDNAGNSTVTQYDGLGREAKITDMFGNQYITNYNLNGDGVGFKALSYFVPSSNTTSKQNVVEYNYDRWQRVTSEKAYTSYPDEYVETNYTYDIVGNTTEIIDPNGNKQNFVYDKLNRVISSTNTLGETIENIYDNVGNIKTQKVCDSISYNRVYDGEGKIVSDTDSLNNSNTYSYNNRGLLNQRIDKDGKIYNVEYNALGYIDRQSYIIKHSTLSDRQYIHTSPHGNGSINMIAEYNNDENTYYAYEDEKDSKNYTYTGKLQSNTKRYNYSTGVNGLQYVTHLRYTYDSIGNRISATYGCADDDNQLVHGLTTHYEYNRNRISKVQLDGDVEKNSADSVNARYEFYDDGKLKSITFPTLTDGNVLKSEYMYDGLSRLTRVVNYKGTDILSSYTYTYDNNGNILTTNETVGSVQNSVTYTYDKLNRISTVSGTKGADSYYEYDDKGNRKYNFEEIDFLSEESAEFRYNEEDKLYYASVGEDVTYFEYSSDGYRVAKYENSSYPEFYIYDETGRLQGISEPVYVTIEGETHLVMYPTTQYIWGPDRVLAQINSLTNSSYYYLYNGHGDVVQIVDTDGNIVNTYDYDVWGNFLKKEETIENHFTYFGQTYDETTGLYYLRARYYDPSTGRFTQQDPAEDGYNWYVYGNQNPNKYADIYGLDARVITASNAASKFGHTSLLLEHENTGEWSYYYFGPSKNGMPIWTAKVILQKVPNSYTMSDGSIIKPLDNLSDLNKWLVASGVHSAKGFNDYDKSVYIQGDFTNSIRHAQNDVKKNNGKFNWNDEVYVAVGSSCSTESMEVLYKGNFTKYQGFWGYIQKIRDYPALSQVIPNQLHSKLTKIFGNSNY